MNKQDRLVAFIAGIDKLMQETGLMFQGTYEEETLYTAKGSKILRVIPGIEIVEIPGWVEKEKEDGSISEPV